jgi:hypothetical protein
VLFALQQTGLGLLDYLPALVTRFLQALFAAGTVAIASLGMANFSRLPRKHAQMLTMFVALNAFYAVMSLLFGGIRVIFHVESVLMALALVPVIGSTAVWLTVLRTMFWCGMILILLNLVPLLHWAGTFNLQPDFIPRLVDTGEDLSSLDAYSFGIFGRTESNPVEGMFFPRLQGWALEPLHWAYFVALTLGCGMLLRELSRSAYERLMYACTFPVIAVHLYFIYSASLLLTLAAWLLAVLALAFVRLFRVLRQRETAMIFIVVIVGSGFLVPFALSLIPNIEALLYTEQVLGKGDNWSSKIGFLSFGADLYTRFMPLNQPDLQTSHNLVLELYLHYGYILLLPALWFFREYFRRAVAGAPFMLAAAALLILLTHLILVPSALFYPAGVLFLVLVMVALDHHGPRVAAD